MQLPPRYAGPCRWIPIAIMLTIIILPCRCSPGILAAPSSGPPLPRPQHPGLGTRAEETQCLSQRKDFKISSKDLCHAILLLGQCQNYIFPESTLDKYCSWLAEVAVLMTSLLSDDVISRRSVWAAWACYNCNDLLSDDVIFRCSAWQAAWACYLWGALSIYIS